jgi:hypothetical protein
MNVAFVIDTSSSMGQSTPEGISFLDCAKSCAEAIVKSKQNYQYHLIITGASYSIRSSWEHDTFHLTKSISTLNRQDHDLGLNHAVSIALSQLNMFRHMTGTDTYGFGRNTSRIEPGVVLIFTDNSAETLDPSSWGSSCEFTEGPWRYDQRIILVQICSKIPSVGVRSKIELIGGGVLRVESFKQIIQLADTLTSSILPQQCFNAHLLLDDKQPIPISFLIDKKKQQNWPLPEEYTSYNSALPSRSPNPVLKLHSKITYTSFNIPQDFIYDEYDAIVTEQVAENLCKKSTSPVFLMISAKTHIQPFAILFIHENTIKLLVFCYNFTELWECLDFYRNPLASKTDASRIYEERLSTFLRELPAYYHFSLPNAFRKMKLYLPSSLKLPTGIAMSTEIANKLKNKGEQEIILKRELDQVGKVLADQHASRRAYCCLPSKYTLFSDIFAIDRKELEGSIASLCQQFFTGKHQMPISQMGNYHAVNKPIFRDPYLEPEHHKITPINFGNPFRKLTSRDVVIDDPNIALPTNAPSPKQQAPKIQLITIPVKRPRGFKETYSQFKFIKRQQKSKIYLRFLTDYLLSSPNQPRKR